MNWASVSSCVWTTSWGLNEIVWVRRPLSIVGTDYHWRFVEWIVYYECWLSRGHVLRRKRKVPVRGLRWREWNVLRNVLTTTLQILLWSCWCFQMNKTGCSLRSLALTIDLSTPGLPRKLDISPHRYIFPKTLIPAEWASISSRNTDTHSARL